MRGSLRLGSWGRSFLFPSSRPFSLRRAVRMFLAARRRWPDGRLSVRLRGGFAVLWLVPAGICPPGSEVAGVWVWWSRPFRG